MAGHHSGPPNENGTDKDYTHESMVRTNNRSYPEPGTKNSHYCTTPIVRVSAVKCHDVYPAVDGKADHLEPY